MKKQLLVVLALYATSCFAANALQITEIFSNPTGDDNGREWIEVFNDTADPVDISSLSLSIKNATPITVTLVSGGSLLQPGAYAIIGSTVSGATKFALDYPTYSGSLFKSSISLVNTGVTSVDIRLGGVVMDSVASYTAAKEGYSYSKTTTGFAVMSPTPGKDSGTDGTPALVTTESTSTPVVGTQTTIPQMSPPSADILLYLQQEKVVVAGAPSIFSVSALTQSGKQISNITFAWSFGDGGQGVGSSTVYRYYHPGRYIAYVDASNGLVAGKARMLVKVVSPELYLSTIKSSKYGQYLEINNPNVYELDVSTWKLSIDGAMYSLPLNTVLLPGTTTISGVALGFASSSVSTSSVIKLLFSSNEEVVKVTQEKLEEKMSVKKEVTSSAAPINTPKPVKSLLKKDAQSKKVTPSAHVPPSSTITQEPLPKKDKRIAEFFKGWFN